MDQKTYTLEEIREWCKKYDLEVGRYPESKYEGFSVYDYISTNGFPTDRIAEWEQELKDQKELDEHDRR